MTERIFKMRAERDGFTVVELLTVIAIIAILVGIFIPTVSFVRNTAKEAKQSVQLTAIDMALMAFRGDYGDYPPSTLDEGVGTGYYYCGSQKLAEALVGWDLLGFHPDSQFIAANHTDDAGVYDGDDEDNLDDRIGPYLELTTANAFTLRQLFGTVTTDLALDRYVLCDSFASKTVTISGTSKTITTKAGLPILYYKANTSSKVISIGGEENRIYNMYDNADIIALNSPATPDPLLSNFYDSYIIDPKVTARDWPYRPDSYILISAGVDGLYGTPDDICNF